MSKNNFILYKDFKPTLELLSDEQAGKLIKAVFDYVEDRTEQDFTNDGMLLMAFSMLKTQLERDLEKYKKTVERNQKNGAKGGRPKNKAIETHSVIKNPHKPTGLIGNPTKPKKADSVSDSERDNDSDNKKSKPKKFVKPTLKQVKEFCSDNYLNIDEQYFIDYYNSNGWKVGRNAMKDWKATVRNWSRKNQPKQQTVDLSDI